MMNAKNIFYNCALLISSTCFLPMAMICALIVRLKYKIPLKPRIVWGSTPIINNSYWSRALDKAGYSSETYTLGFYSVINSRQDWNRLLSEQYRWLPMRARPYCAFIHSLFLYDIFCISFDGFFIGNTPARYCQALLLRFAKKKIVVIPYGSDSYVYKNIRSVSTMHGLLMSYPMASRNQYMIEKNVEYWTKNSDLMLTGCMGPDGFGRWDALLPSTLFIDLDLWKESRKFSHANGINEEVVIAHAPNHRGFKGSEFVIEAVKILRDEGLNINLKLLEGIQNECLRNILELEADILIEQLIVTGHGMNGLEGLASGLPTISNLEDDSYILPFRRWSYFSECPIVSATPESIVQVLRKLVTSPQLRHKLGRAGRTYVEKYHGLDSAQYLFTNVIDYLYNRKESLINLYHPLLGEYTNRSPKISHPLVNNHIVD